MNEAILLAVDLAFALSLEMVIWSAGLIAFEPTFLAPEQADKTRRLILIGILLIYLTSIAFGAVCLMSLVGELTDRQLPQKLDLYERLVGIRWTASVQAATFLIGTLLTAWLAFMRMFRPS